MISVPQSSPQFFEAKYEKEADPWGFAESPYELSRYDTIIRALGLRRYLSAFEPGCSVGVLTERLAAICDRVLAVDFSATAVAQARARCGDLSHVEVECGALGDGIVAQLPIGCDLLVLSEIGYYFSPEAWQRIVSELISAMPRGGTIVAAHWLGHSTDHVLTGDQVHEVLRGTPCLELQHEERHPGFRLDRWVRL